VRRSLSDAEKQRLVDVVAQATRDGLSGVERGELEAGWERLEQSLSAGKYPSVPIVRGYVTPWYLRGIVFVSMILGVGIVADFARYQREMTPLAPLNFVAQGAAVGAEQSIEARADAPADLIFSDRSRVHLEPNAKIAVLAMDSHGARVALAGGELDVAVTRRQGSSWRFEAGPFTVAVKGTAFRLGFDAARGRMALQMREGTVEVSGPSPNRRLTLRAGESLELFASEPHAEAATTGAGLAQATSAAPAAEVAPSLRPPAHRVRTPHGSESAAEPATGDAWARLIARGQFAAVVDDAEARGLDATLAAGSAAELTALADAARYTRRHDVARRALLRIRERFPDSPRSRDAAFFLGRLAEAASPSPRAALDWYEAYLREAGQGPYAGEALAREITLSAEVDPARARSAARRYLERFPHGTQAELARSSLRTGE
jgi:hypothetical protein